MLSRARARFGLLLSLSFLFTACLTGETGVATTVVADQVPTAAQTDGAGTVWLCRPGLVNNPCLVSADGNVVSATGTSSFFHAPDATNSKFDCFYVYPTVSAEKSANANLKIQPAETEVAVEQASRFSQVCQVWAPVYRQRTVASLALGLGAAANSSRVAYQSALSAWKDYLAHYNHGRPIIFIGHSQGAAILIQLLESQVDSNSKLRKQLVSAIILGGNVQVPTGKLVGGSFAHIPGCVSAKSVGCVIAYSSFSAQPPSNSLFGRPGQGVSLQSGQFGSDGVQVLCVNPAGFAKTATPLDSFFAQASLPLWLEYKGLYTGQCESSLGATWLQITSAAGPGDKRPVVSPTLGPTWGLHLYDVNLTLGNLVRDVGSEEAAFSKR